MMRILIYFIYAFLGFCVGVIIVGLLTDKQFRELKSENTRLRKLYNAVIKLDK